MNYRLPSSRCRLVRIFWSRKEESHLDKLYAGGSLEATRSRQSLPVRLAQRGERRRKGFSLISICHFRPPVPSRIRRKSPALIRVVAVLLCAAVFAKQPAVLGDSPGIALLKQANDVESAAQSFVCDITDNIRRKTTPYFRRTLPDGTVEITTVFSGKPLRVGIQNKQGFWMITQKEAVKLNYRQAQHPRPEKAILHLKAANPDDVIIKVEKQTIEDGADCQLVEADLSDRLTRQLAVTFRAAHKTSPALKRDPDMDMLQFIAKRRLFWIGTANHLLWRYREYDGNGDLLTDISLSGQVLNRPIPDDVFAVPKDLV